MEFNETFNSKKNILIINLKDESNKEMKVFINTQDIIMASFVDNDFALQLLYRDKEKHTLRFTDVNEQEYYRIKDTFNL